MYSQYVLRGITNAPEDDSVALQGSAEWSQGDTGWYAGVWSSSLGYSEQSLSAGGSLPANYPVAAGNLSTSDAFENDFYAGYKGKFGSVSWSLGFIQYIYLNVEEFNGLEAVGSLGIGPVTLGFQTLTNDVVWGNSGDTYWTLTYNKEKIIRKWDFTVKAGFYTYETSGDFIPQAANAEDSAFRHVDVTFAHPIGNTGAKFNITGIFGGDDRFGNNQDDTIVVGISYDFDI